MEPRPTITIIGPGKVGCALGRVARRVGYRIAAVSAGRDETRTAKQAAEMDAPILPLAQAAAAGQIVLLTVKDGAIQPVCEQLAATGALAHQPVVAHCSGALSSDILTAAKKLHCPVASMHPLQTFPSIDAAISRLPGTFWFLEGEDDAITPLTQLAKALGGHPRTLLAKDRPLYHAAAVFGANYLTTLLDAALTLLHDVGLTEADARDAISPLTRATIDNVLTLSPAKALTGPIARGDTHTVKAHLDALRKTHPELLDLYRTVGCLTAQLAQRTGLAKAEPIETLLQHEGHDV